MPIGNLLEEVTSGCIIHQVNAQGVMGSGFALAIRKKYPVVWDDYSSIISPFPAHDISASRLGEVIISEVAEGLEVASIVGQQFYGTQGSPEGRRYTSYDAIDVALSRLAEHSPASTVFHYPLLGSDRGGAKWQVVREIINHRLANFEHHLWVLDKSIDRDCK